MLVINNFHTAIESKPILKGIQLQINPGEIHAIMGPNGSGKTTLVMSLMGHPYYMVQKGSVVINEKDITTVPPEERAKEGLFVSFQSPVEVTGVSFLAFLRTASKALRPTEKTPLSEFKKQVREALQSVGLDESFMHRSVNEGFSGGERKRAEIAQLLVLKPRYAILDEIDSGLDVDSLRIVSAAVLDLVTKHNVGLLVITHYQRILHHLKPDFVHVLIDGKIKKSGTVSLVQQIEKEGYIHFSAPSI